MKIKSEPNYLPNSLYEKHVTLFSEARKVTFGNIGIRSQTNHGHLKLRNT